MYIHVIDGAGHVHEAADLQRLSVRMEPGTELATSLGALGTADDDGEHVWLHIDTLREAAAATITDDVDAWRAGFDGMIAYATKSGWTDATGSAVRAHIES